MSTSSQVERIDVLDEASCARRTATFDISEAAPRTAPRRCGAVPATGRAALGPPSS